ncbi:unnamed protein product [Amaranthus hypochondriacus]
MAAAAINNPMNSIPQHLFIQEILVRLPVESLLRCKIVCKEWNSIISSRDFAELQLNFWKSKPSYNQINSLFLSANEYFTLIKYKDFEKDDWYEVFIPNFPLLENRTIHKLFMSVCLRDSCNGLVCFYIAYNGNTNNNFFFIWNPYTNHFKHVFFRNNLSFHIEIAGFFYVENDYKIVAFGFYNKSDTKWGGVYSLKTNLWTEIPLQNLPFDIGLTILIKSVKIFYPLWRRGVIVDEMLYWKIKDPSKDNNDIIGFNIKDYTFHQLPFSSTNPNPYKLHMNIRNIGGSLCSCGYAGYDSHDELQKTCIEIWRFEYKENSSELWTLMFKLDVQGFEQTFYDIIGFTKDGKIIMKNEKCKLFVVNQNEDHTTFVPIIDHWYFEAIKFNASLVSPCHYTIQDTEEEVNEALYERMSLNTEEHS